MNKKMKEEKKPPPQQQQTFISIIIAIIVIIILSVISILLAVGFFEPRKFIFCDGSQYTAQGNNTYGYGVFAGREDDLNCSTLLTGGEQSGYITEIQPIIQTLKKLKEDGGYKEYSLYVCTDCFFTVIGLQKLLIDWPLQSVYDPKLEANLGQFCSDYNPHLKVIIALASYFRAVYIYFMPSHQDVLQCEVVDCIAKLSASGGNSLDTAVSNVLNLNREQSRARKKRRTKKIHLTDDVHFVNINNGARPEFHLEHEETQRILDQNKHVVRKMADIIDQDGTTAEEQLLKGLQGTRELSQTFLWFYLERGGCTYADLFTSFE